MAQKQMHAYAPGKIPIFHIMCLFLFSTTLRNKSWHNNIMVEKKTHKSKIAASFLSGLFSAGSEVFHLNMLIAFNRQKRLWHMLLSQPTSTTPTTLSPSPLPFPLNSRLLSRTLPEQTNGYPPISAVSLRPLWTFLFARKYLSFNNVTGGGCHTGSRARCKCPSSEHRRDSAAWESFQWCGPHRSRS